MPWPQAVAKRFDHVIGGDRDVSGALIDHPEHRGNNAANRGNLTPVFIACGWQRVIMPEQLVGAVNQMDVQIAALQIATLQIATLQVATPG